MQTATEPACGRDGDEIAAGSVAPAHQSDLVELCFPKSAPESDLIRRLAYANSICLMFLVVAVIGLQTPVFVIETPKPAETPIPVVFEPPPIPQTPPSLIPQSNNDLPEPDQPVVDAPQVAPVVVADSADVAFAIPVEGPVILTPAKYAAPPPRVIPPPAPSVTVSQPGPPKPVEFDRGARDGGFYPEPDYPPIALRKRMEGRVMLYVVVDESGRPKTLEVRDSSGWKQLDDHVLSHVKRRWHWPAGKERHFLIPFRFQLTKN